MSAQPPPAPPRSLWSRLRRHARHLRAARWSLIGGLLAGVVYSLSSGVGLPVMFKTVLPIFFGREAEASPRVVAWAKQMFGEAYHDKLLLTACLGLPLVFLLRGLSQFANRYLVNKAGFIVLERVRQEVFARLLRLPLTFYHRHQSGDLVNRLMNDTEQLRAMIVNVSAEILKQPFTLLSAAGYLLYLSITDRSALFVLIALASVPLCVFPIRLVARHLAKRSRELARQGGSLAAVCTETLQSPLEVQAYNLEDHQQGRFAARVREILRLSLKAVKYQSLTAPSIEFVSVCGFMAALYFGVQHGMDFGTFSALGVALFLCYEPVKKLGGINEAIKSRVGSLERIEEVLDAPDTVVNPAAPRPLPPATAEIEFVGVSFRYPTAALDAPAALNDVSVRLVPGEVVALVGPSGAGKTTFALMIPRFFDPTAGAVRLGGVDLRELDKTALRSRVALMPQVPVLFHTSIAENIRLGRLDATDAEVREAARKAHIADVIAALPQGYDTVVGERGTSLSGGQRQRIAIARAFLKDAPILILDEATSALDAESEAQVQAALRELVRGRTTLMIAHRFSSLGLATRVLVFEEGRITGDGAPEELATRHPVYRRMLELQRLGAE